MSGVLFLAMNFSSNKMKDGEMAKQQVYYTSWMGYACVGKFAVDVWDLKAENKAPFQRQFKPGATCISSLKLWPQGCWISQLGQGHSQIIAFVNSLHRRILRCISLFEYCTTQMRKVLFHVLDACKNSKGRFSWTRCTKLRSSLCNLLRKDLHVSERSVVHRHAYTQNTCIIIIDSYIMNVANLQICCGGWLCPCFCESYRYNYPCYWHD